MHCVCMVEILYHDVITGTHLFPTPHSVISHWYLGIDHSTNTCTTEIGKHHRSGSLTLLPSFRPRQRPVHTLTSVLGSSEPRAWPPGLPLGLVSAPAPPLSFSSGGTCAQFNTLPRSESLVSAQTLGYTFSWHIC